jgi:hypothetical protein
MSFTQFTATSALPAGSMAQAAAVALQGQDKVTGLNSTELINMLDLIDETQFMNVTSGNITLTVSKGGPVHFELSNGIRYDDDNIYTYFEWVYIYNGIDFNRVKLTFKNGALSRFDDDRAAHPVGSIDINVSKEQAIETAKNYISGFMNKYNLTIAKITAVLGSTWNETGALHPFWGVKILFNENVSGVHVYVWADSGLVDWSYRDNGSPFNVADYEPAATEAPIQPDATETPTPSPSPTSGDTAVNDYQSNQQTNNETVTSQAYNWTQPLTIIGVIIIAAIAAIGLLLSTKRRSD